MNPATQTRILIVKLSSLGDLLHALPAVRALKSGLGARIDWVTQPEYADFVRCFDDVERVIAFPRRGFLFGASAFLRALRAERYEIAVDLQGLLKSALVARAARARRRIGPPHIREGAHLLHDETPPASPWRRHAVEEALDVVRHLGLPLGEPVFPMTLPRRVPGGDAPHVALVPCSRWTTKNWPAIRFAEVARALVRERRATIHLVGGPADRAMCEAIEQAVPEARFRNACGQTGIVEMASLLQAMDLVITLDSGPMHIADALGRPVVAVFGATNPERTGPFGQLDRVVARRDLPCWPCHSRTCALGRPACILDLPSEPVIAAALERLSSFP